MNHKLLVATFFAACAFAVVSSAFTNNLVQLAPTPKGTSVSATAKGTFDVKATPEPAAESDDSGIARLALDKQFHGDLEAVSKGQLLAANTLTKGSAGYVAIETVTGTLAGRKGSFTLQHIGTMNRGVPSLNVSVIPIPAPTSSAASPAKCPSTSKTANTLTVSNTPCLTLASLGPHFIPGQRRSIANRTAGRSLPPAIFVPLPLFAACRMSQPKPRSRSPL